MYRRGGDGAWELWRRAVGVASRRYGGMEASCKRADVEAKRHGALEARCRRKDVESVELWSSGAPEAHCRCSDDEV